MHGFTKVLVVSCIGDGRDRAGGQACFWNDNIEVQILSLSLNFIDMLVSVDAGEQVWRCTGIYGFPETNAKAKTCELINQLADKDPNDK